MLARIALLFGLFAAPLLLLALGHRVRDASHREKARFWGGVVGYIVGMLVTVLAMMLPPTAWGDAASLRTLVVHWSMLVGFALGLLLGPPGLGSQQP